MVNFVRRFIKDYAEVTAPLIALLTREDFVLKSRLKKARGSEQDNALARIKRVLSPVPVLHLPDFSREFALTAEAVVLVTPTKLHISKLCLKPHCSYIDVCATIKTGKPACIASSQGRGF